MEAVESWLKIEVFPPYPGEAIQSVHLEFDPELSKEDRAVAVLMICKLLWSHFPDLYKLAPEAPSAVATVHL